MKKSKLLFKKPETKAVLLHLPKDLVGWIDKARKEYSLTRKGYVEAVLINHRLICKRRGSKS